MRWETLVQPPEFGSKPLVIDPSLWGRVLKVAGRSGFYPADLNIISRNEMRFFVPSLKKSDDPEILALLAWIQASAPEGFRLVKRPRP